MRWKGKDWSGEEGKEKRWGTSASFSWAKNSLDYEDSTFLEHKSNFINHFALILRSFILRLQLFQSHILICPITIAHEANFCSDAVLT